MPLLGAFIVPHPPLIVPEVGKGRETGIKSTVRAYEKIGQKIAEASPETIIVISPHSVIYGDYIHISPGRSARGSLKNFGVPGVIMEKKYDADFAEALGEEAELNGIPAGTLGERDPSLDHGVLVPLYFIDRYFKKEYKLIRLSISGLTFLEHYRFGKCISDVSDRLSRRIVIVASGDLSHKLTPSGPYGYCAEGPEFDARAVGAMKSGDFSVFLNFGEEFCEKAAECGLRSFVEMAGALDGKAVRPDFLSYEG
ncbi:MAG: class III extradiol dioxygenase subunit B-like domain-containing protein, partial [Bacillota bacterium]|nr:class III extradiol dioxygenase subunit B-like domain-containing protein [Bacillota bacterium]